MARTLADSVAVQANIPPLPEGLAWFYCKEARQQVTRLWALVASGNAVAVLNLSSKPRLRAWYRSPQHYQPAWGITGRVTPGELQHGLGGFWDKVAAGAVYEVVYGHCGLPGSKGNSRWPPGKVLCLVTWEPPPLCRYRPGDVVPMEPGALPSRGPSGWTARKLKLAAEVA